MSDESSTIIQGYLKRMQDEYENFNTVYNDLLTKLNLAQTEYTKQDDQFKKLLTDETNLVTIYSSSTRQNFDTEFEKVQSAAQAKILNISQVPEELDEFIKLANLDLEGVRNQLNEISQNVAAIKDEANAQIDSINRELPKVTEAGQKAIEDMNKVVNQVTASGQTLQQQINELDLRLSGIVNNQSNISKDITAVNEQITKANQDVATLNTNIDKANNRIDQINQQIGDIVKIRTDIDTLKINKADKAFVDAQLAQKTWYENTVSDMVSKAYEVGSVIKTLGYYAVNDGGSNLYSVIELAEKSYDITGEFSAFRPIINGVIHPKMFGTVNDGVALDNLGVQKCFDYSYDLGIANIDGLNLLYNMGTVNQYDAVTRGWAHTGACVRAGRKLSNFRFKTANGSTNGTTPLGILMEDNGQSIHLDSIEIDGNRLNVVQLDSFDGKEDGGLHGINIMHSGSTGFLPCGDIYMTNCKVNKVYSYGISIQRPLDCKMVLKNCDFDVHGIAVQFHTTTVEVLGGKVTTSTPRTGMVVNPFHIEMELGGSYTGDKKPSILVDGVDFNSFNPSTQLFKIHYSPMAGLHFKHLKFINCKLNGNSLLHAFNHTEVDLAIDNVEIMNIENPKDLIRFDSKNISVGNIDIKNKKGMIILANCQIDKFHVSGFDFDLNTRFFSSGAKIGELTVEKSTGKNLNSNYGIFRDATSNIKSLRVNDLVVEQKFRLFESVFESIEVKDMTLMPNPDTLLHTTAFFVWKGDSPKAEFRANNVFLTGKGYDGNYNFFVDFNNQPNGFVYLNNVKHYAVATPLISGVTKKVLINCEPLFVS